MYRYFIQIFLIFLFILIVGCSETGQQAHTGTPPGQNPAIDQDVSGNNTPGNNTPGNKVPGEAKHPVVVHEEIVQDAVVGQSVVKREAEALAASPMYRSLEKRLSNGAMPGIRMPSEPLDRENYAHFDDNPVKRVTEYPVSTFSIDVDTGSYANIRRFLKAGQLPARDAVRAEELINYFSYDYALPADNSTPFSVVREIAPTPWNPDTHLLHIGIQGYELPPEQLPAANLVFLVDISGSMQSANKLELLKSSLKLLTNHLDKDDRVSLVVYAGGTGVVLEPTAGDQKAKITSALDQLVAGGRTNGAAGIKLAYAMAEQGYLRDGINRVILATDGDFNVGTTGIEQLQDLIGEKRKSGIALSTLGFGTGNYNDHLMEQLADRGNGNYAYIDTLGEAQKVLVDEMTSTLLTIAKDVKIQIEFNPAVVEEYRLVGYENRQLKREDFNNDKIDAGEIGAGHSVTALYEIALKGSNGTRIDPLRYKSEEAANVPAASGEIAFLRLRYKEPGSDTSRLLEWPVKKQEIQADIQNTSDNFLFAAAVAAFAQQLRGGDYLETFGYDDVLTLAGNARGRDPFGYRGEFLTLVNLAKSLSVQKPVAHVKDM